MVRENAAKTGSHFWYAVRSPPAIVVRARARARGAPAANGGIEVGDPLPGQVPGNLPVLPRVAGAVVDDDQARAQGVFHARGPQDLPDVAVVAPAPPQDVDG